MNKTIQSSFLFAQPSFASGTARTLDLWGKFDEYNRSESGAEADALAISADWFIVGQDLCNALGQQELELERA